MIGKRNQTPRPRTMPTASCVMLDLKNAMRRSLKG
jgi:hypothetical protein